MSEDYDRLKAQKDAIVARQSGWQPIETAPKGRSVFVSLLNAQGHRRATPTLREAITTEAERWPRPKAKRRTPA